MTRALGNLASILANGRGPMPKLKKSNRRHSRSTIDSIPTCYASGAPGSDRHGRRQRLCQRCRLAGVEPPKYEDNETTFPELAARVQKTIAYLETFKPEQIDGTEDKAHRCCVTAHQDRQFPRPVLSTDFRVAQPVISTSQRPTRFCVIVVWRLVSRIFLARFTIREKASNILANGSMLSVKHSATPHHSRLPEMMGVALLLSATFALVNWIYSVCLSPFGHRDGWLDIRHKS